MNSTQLPGPQPAPPTPGGPLFRRYLAWAEPRYRKMDAPTEAWARQVDLWLYTSTPGRLFIGAMMAAVLLIAWGLHRSGTAWWLAVPLAFGLWSIALGTMLMPWIKPQGFERRFIIRTLTLGSAGGALGFVVGTAIAVSAKGGVWDWGALALKAGKAVPVVLGILGALILLQSGIARWRRHSMAQELERLQLLHERDVAALRSQEAELRVLQAQIQPHFIFNTLAALQHWVDVGDPRAGPLLRALTGFLRSGTELMSRDRVPLGDEVQMAGQYLSIMAHRLGTRLQWRAEVPGELLAFKLPPGLLMTLVENAVEHAVEPSLHPVTVTLGGALQAGGASLWVQDDGAGWSAGTQPAEGVGLSNLRARLLHAFGPGAALALVPRAEGGCRATITWPVETAP